MNIAYYMAPSAFLSVIARVSVRRQEENGNLLAAYNSCLLWSISSLANRSLGVFNLLPFMTHALVRSETLQDQFPVTLKVVDRLNKLIAPVAILVYSVAAAHLMLTNAPVVGGAIFTMLFLGAVKTYASPPKELDCLITVLEAGSMIVGGGLLLKVVGVLELAKRFVSPPKKRLEQTAVSDLSWVD